MTQLADFVSARVLPVSNELDRSQLLMREVAFELMQVLRILKQGHVVMVTNAELDLIFSGSAALGFTIGQHFAAIDRLSTALEWQANNCELWQQLSSGKVLCGLATTHLARPGPPILTGSKVEAGHRVSGNVFWSCGLGIFSKLVSGFEADEEIVFGLTDYPSTGLQSIGISAKLHILACYHGTCSASMEFTDSELAAKAVISRRGKVVTVKPRTTSFVGHEIGIGMSALNLLTIELAFNNHPKTALIKGL